MKAFFNSLKRAWAAFHKPPSPPPREIFATHNGKIVRVYLMDGEAHTAVGPSFLKDQAGERGETRVWSGTGGQPEEDHLSGKGRVLLEEPEPGSKDDPFTVLHSEDSRLPAVHYWMLQASQANEAGDQEAVAAALKKAQERMPPLEEGP
jgi:hypothetical protein